VVQKWGWFGVRFGGRRVIALGTLRKSDIARSPSFALQPRRRTTVGISQIADRWLRMA
jgi:hypothetical protein